METKKLKDEINSYLRKSAKKKIIARGKSILDLDGVYMLKGGKNRWEFEVEGTYIYDVTVFKTNDKLSSKCTCRYDWGGICKHQVAALKYMLSNIDKLDLLEAEKTSIKNLRKRIGEKQKLEIKNYKLLKKDDIFVKVRRHKGFYISDYMNLNYEIYGIAESRNRIKFYLGYDSPDNVFIEKEDGKVYIYSTILPANNDAYSLDEAMCLLMIANSMHPNALDLFFNNKFKSKERAIMADLGFTEKEFLNYYYYVIDEMNGLHVRSKSKTKNLLSLSSMANNPMVKHINSEQKNIIIDNLPETKELFALGFVLEPNNFRNNIDPSLPDLFDITYYSVEPIIGKLNKNKTKIISQLKRYSRSFLDINISENARNILNLLDNYSNIDSEIDKFIIFKKIFDLLADEPFVYELKEHGGSMIKKNLEQTKLSKTPVNIVFKPVENGEVIELDMNLKLGDNIVSSSLLDWDRSCYIMACINNTYHIYSNLEVSEYIGNYTDSLIINKKYKKEFYEQVVAPLSKNFEVDFSDNVYSVKSYELDFISKQIFLSEKNSYIIITPQVEYSNGISTKLSNTGSVLDDNEDVIIEYKRNSELENSFLETISQLHPLFEEQKINKLFYLHIEDFTNNLWFYNFFDAMQKENIQVFGLKELKSFKYSPFKGQLSTSVKSGIDWFEVNIEMVFGNNVVKLKDIQKAIINKQKYIQLKDGSVGIMPSEWLQKLEKYFRVGDINKNKLQISQLKFSIIDELFDQIDDEKVIAEITQKKDRLKKFSQISDTKIPSKVKADLRHYQKEGLNWLNFLHEMKWGGILADDMGLGKTLQVLTFLQHINTAKKSTSLIIVPTTLLFNWKNEIAKFTPALKAIYHYGADREDNSKNFKKYHLVFTTYGILLRDIDILKEFSFNYIILDESQAIKNPASRRYKATHLLQASNRIALTGTPIENSTFDLFAQMSFVNPGFFGNIKHFKDNFSNPIDKNGENLIAEELQRIINPFVLRRTKENVANELPDKTEDIIYCNMEAAQRKVYDAYRNTYRETLLKNIEKEGLGKSKIMILEALTRLRQICDSPSLLKNDDINENQSIKIKEIVKHITEKTRKHKILIFSQFVGMLSLLKDELTKLNISYEYLDGKCSSKQREISVNNFQKNKNLRVFLISLKAGGTGLNLTAADYVYIVDPWWNPAVENQAIDRCYRIGQNKKVFAYRMICSNTIEEKIVLLQNKKKKIAKDIIQTDESIMAKINTNDINELFS